MGIEHDPEIQNIFKKIRVDLLESFFSNIRKNWKLFENKDELLLQLTVSIIMNFNIEIISHTISTFGLESQRKQFIKDIFEQVRDKVNQEIKSRMM